MMTDERCSWCGDDPLYVDYHDREWGMPERGSRALFELLILEGMQAGLAWITVLRKRARMREQFFGFDAPRLAAEGERHLEDWLEDAGIIRHRGKLEAMIANARAYLEVDDFPRLVWSFVDDRPRQNGWRSLAELPADTEQSRAMAKALKARGFRFVGPTTCYAFMQGAGLVNDHLTTCPAYRRCREAS